MLIYDPIRNKIDNYIDLGNLLEHYPNLPTNDPSGV